ncbi:TIGR04255 family protein [Pseudomonas syringae]|uniref:TIGR04255 family protein n=1 Tax=Pseudomonas syringae TaxID=317 RepID=UPI000C08CD70|nr:TIGR04255 family protein [Pseudomonas syringae]
MPDKLSNAPVYYAIAQAQFNPVPAMHKYVDEIQDRLRRSGFTLFEPQQQMHLQIPETGGALTEPQFTQTSLWLLTKEDRSSGFILNTNSLSFHTTHYETRREFIPALLMGLAAVHDVVGLSHFSRLGLRYLDAVLPQDGESVEKYLTPGLHGLHFPAPRVQSTTESVFQTECSPMITTGQLLSRVYMTHGVVGFPPDLIPHGLTPKPKFTTQGLFHAVIDTDHSVSGHMPVDLELLEAQLKDMHTSIKKIFAATVTDHANRIWA